MSDCQFAERDASSKRDRILPTPRPTLQTLQHAMVYRSIRTRSRLRPLGSIRTDEVGVSSLSAGAGRSYVGAFRRFDILIYLCWPTRPTRCHHKNMNLLAVVDLFELRTLFDQ